MSIETPVSKSLPDFSPLVSPRARTLTIWAGRLTIAIAALHIAYFTVDTVSSWSGWATGTLWGTAGSRKEHMESMRDFWALPGGFALPLILLGLLISRLAHAGRALPAYAGWLFTSWVVLSAGILMPSGFLFGLIPAGMLLAAHRLNSKALQP